MFSSLYSLLSLLGYRSHFKASEEDFGLHYIHYTKSFPTLNIVGAGCAKERKEKRQDRNSITDT